MSGAGKVGNGGPVCSRTADPPFCRCPVRHPRLARLLNRWSPKWATHVPSRLASWVGGPPCWLGPDEAQVPDHWRWWAS